MSFSTKIRQSEGHFKLARQLVDHLATTYNLDAEKVWLELTNKDCDYYVRLFKREHRKNDPMSAIKNRRTAFSIFTKEQRALIAAENVGIKFGELSKLVGQKWKALDNASKNKYLAEEAKDKARYDEERQAIRRDIANRTVADQTTSAVVEPVLADVVVPTKKTARVKKAVDSTATAVTATSVSATVPAPVSAPKAKKASAPKTTASTAVVVPAMVVPAMAVPAVPAVPAVAVAVSAPAKKAGKAKQAPSVVA